jgi:hypothetical protein
MCDAKMAREKYRAAIKVLLPSKDSTKPCFSAMLGQKIGMEDGAITKDIFQHAIDGGAAGAGKMKKA